MKKTITILLCVLMIFSLIGCGGKDKQYNTTIQIGEVIYYNTGDVVPVEPDESIVIDAHPKDGDEIESYAIINPGDVDELVVGLIDGEWYKFLPKDTEPKPE